MIDLILGGARSGKSRLAEQRAHASGQQVVYIATAQHLDGEMAERIQHHQSRRPHQWTTVEEPVALAQALQTLDAPNRLILVDCRTRNLICTTARRPAPRAQGRVPAVVQGLLQVVAGGGR